MYLATVESEAIPRISRLHLSIRYDSPSGNNSFTNIAFPILDGSQPNPPVALTNWYFLFLNSSLKNSSTDWRPLEYRHSDRTTMHSPMQPRHRPPSEGIHKSLSGAVVPALGIVLKILIE